MAEKNVRPPDGKNEPGLLAGGAIWWARREEAGAVDFLEVFVLLEVVETVGGGGVALEDGVEGVERVANEDVVATGGIAAAAGKGAPFVGGVFGIAVVGAVYFGNQPRATQVFLEAFDVFALIAAGGFGQESERGEDALVGGLGADVAAVDRVEPDPEDDMGVPGGGQ